VPRHSLNRTCLATGLLAVTMALSVWAQPPRKGNQTQSTLPSDQRLLKLHRTFIIDAEKLAIEYEREKDLDKAKAVYGEILKLYPQHQLARNKLKLIRSVEENADKAIITIAGDEGWQYTGFNVIKGKPVRISAKGIWTFRLSVNVPPDGVKIPKELREFNLGSLVGTISNGQENEIEQFLVGNSVTLVPKKSGRLLLRMYDVLPTDNAGEMTVEVRGSFTRARR